MDAKKAGQTVRDEDAQTACSSACPTNAIVFRDVNDWYHIFVRVDTTASTENRRIVGFVNGVEVTWDNANQSGQ